MHRRTLTAASILLALALPAGAADAQERLPGITTPVAEFGFELGADYHLANYQQLMGYWTRLSRESDRMVLDTIGTTEEGRPQLMAIITSPENHRNLDRYRDIAARLAKAEGVSEIEAQRLASEGKAVIWIDGGLHATELLGAQQLMQLVYDMTSLTDAETLRFLDDVILLAIHANPDGHDLTADWYMRNPEPTARSSGALPVLYEKYAGHDNNRDFYMANLAETQNMNRVAYTEWFPQIMYNHHQSGPAGTVMFSPPFRDPPNYNIHPLVLTNLEQVGGHMHARFAREGKGGVTTRSGASYSTWWNGGLRTTPYFHNMIGLLTETIGHPTPMTIPFLPDRQLAEHDLPMPVEPGVWRFKQSVDYSQTANRAVLDFASRNRELLLLNIWHMGQDAIEKGRRDTWDNTPTEIYAAEEAVGPRGDARDFERFLRRPDDREPRGYIIPADQTDFNTAVKFVNALLMNGVEVQRATRAFDVGGESYPAGSFVVRTDQAFAPQVFDMFEPQDHPNDFAYPGGPPIPPYDLTGWTLAYQMDVDFDRVLEGFDAPTETLQAWNIQPEPGTVSGPADAVGWILDHRVNDAVSVVAEVLQDGSDVYWMRDALTAGGERYPAGAFFVAAGPGTRERLQQLARERGVDVRGVASRPSGAALRMRAPRIALLDEYGGSMPSGWTRLIFDDFGIDHDVVFPPDVDRGALSDYDVLVVPDGVADRGSFGDEEDVERVAETRRSIPERWHDRLGVLTEGRSLPQIRSFLEAGGTVVTLGSSTELGAVLGLPLRDHLVDAQGTSLRPEEFFIPGSLVEVDLEPVSPVVHGLDEDVTVLFARDPVLVPEPGAAGIRVLGRYDAQRPLRSGWAWGQETIAGQPAFLEAEVGQGTLYMFGPEITFRGQTHGAFPLFFNTLFYGAAEAVRSTTEGAGG
ncbi:MAG: peptidase [Gemmatimonadetes bacterium]|nr:peptidase [Gemmatimonadota bacterium]